MSTCRKEGKDVIIFATAEDHKEPSTVVLPEPDEPVSLILPNGEINWNCPCLGGMATGPCGVEFRQAFTCFHNSDADPKGSDCFDAFKKMHLCMAEFPQLYNRFNDEEEEDLNDLDIKLTDAEKALISEDNINVTNDKEKKIASDTEKSSSRGKVEEKVGEKKPVHNEPKKPQKSGAPSSALELNA